jgi:hypothetical protein
MRAMKYMWLRFDELFKNQTKRSSAIVEAVLLVSIE